MSQCLHFPTDSPDRIRDRHLRTSIQASAHLVSVSFLEQFHQSILLGTTIYGSEVSAHAILDILRTNAGSGTVSQSRTFNFILLGSSDEKSE